MDSIQNSSKTSLKKVIESAQALVDRDNVRLFNLGRVRFEKSDTDSRVDFTETIRLQLKSMSAQRYDPIRSAALIKPVSDILSQKRSVALTTFNEMPFFVNKNLFHEYYPQHQQIQQLTEFWDFYQFVIFFPFLKDQNLFAIVSKFWKFVKNRRRFVLNRLFNQITESNADLLNIDYVLKLENQLKKIIKRSKRSKRRKDSVTGDMILEELEDSVDLSSNFTLISFQNMTDLQNRSLLSFVDRINSEFKINEMKTKSRNEHTDKTGHHPGRANKYFCDKKTNENRMNRESLKQPVFSKRRLIDCHLHQTKTFFQNSNHGTYKESSQTPQHKLQKHQIQPCPKKNTINFLAFMELLKKQTNQKEENTIKSFEENLSIKQNYKKPLTRLNLYKSFKCFNRLSTKNMKVPTVKTPKKDLRENGLGLQIARKEYMPEEEDEDQGNLPSPDQMMTVKHSNDDRMTGLEGLEDGVEVINNHKVFNVYSNNSLKFRNTLKSGIVKFSSSKYIPKKNTRAIRSDRNIHMKVESPTPLILDRSHICLRVNSKEDPYYNTIKFNFQNCFKRNRPLNQTTADLNRKITTKVRTLVNGVNQKAKCPLNPPARSKVKLPFHKNEFLKLNFCTNHHKSSIEEQRLPRSQAR